MGKKKKIDKKNEKIVRSINNGIRSSVRKLNPILKSIVGKKVDVAIRDLQFSQKRVTRDVRKTISSAVANAENNFQYDIDNLVVKEAYCGKKLTLKETKLLKILHENQNTVMTRKEILTELWGKDDYFLGRSLDVFISRLRKYLKKDIKISIENIRGVGFKLKTLL